VSVSRFAVETFWHIDAPVESVWDAIVSTQMNPVWWPFIEQVVETIPGDSSGVGSTRRYVWGTKLPYTLSFDIHVTRVDRPMALEGVVAGEVEGVGRWAFEAQGSTTVIRHFWAVRLNKPWLRWLAPVAMPLFAWNHRQVMKAGAEGLARFLGVRVISCG
jgi:uncharacterized protein YndB with AHSA1/START domain